ncbi:MAG: hypothetical protein K6T31_07970, partial [Alicyclobacillus sp.]|nr:hypothetical protein [Alicyclobacillus sp.]
YKGGAALRDWPWPPQQRQEPREPGSASAPMEYQEAAPSISTGRAPVWPDTVVRVFSVLLRHDFQAYAVGGCVRDAFLGRPCHDVDIATDARPEQVLPLFSRALATGLRHGTVTVLPEPGETGPPVEVTTFREDLGYSDGRHPDQVRFTRQLEADLARRDLTLNALAMDVHGRVTDPFGGLLDLRARCLRAVGDPNERFAEDGLRIFRTLRLAAELDFTIESQTRAAMIRHASLLQRVSRERIGQELQRIAASNWLKIAADLAEGPYLAVLPAPLPLLRRGWQECVQRSAGLALPQPLPPGWQDKELGPRQQAATWRSAAASLAVWGWAAKVIPQQLMAFCRVLAWPQRWGRWAAAVAAAMNDDCACWPAQVWRRQLYQETEHHVLAACWLLDYWCGGGGRTAVYRQQAARQPLRRLQDLAINGQDLLRLGLNGSAVGQALAALAEAVLAGVVPNEPQALLAAVPSAVQRAAEAYQRGDLDHGQDHA